MNRSMWRTAVLGLAMLIAVPAVSLGQRRGGSRSGGSSRSFGGSRRVTPPKRSAPPKRNFGGSKAKPKSKATAPKGGSKAKSGTKAKATHKPLSKTDKAAFDKAKKSGTAFKSRKAAATDFKAKNAGKYPSKYGSKPATRPTHIPQTTSVGGNTYNISYNAGHGGYGYMGVGGAWMAYSVMADVAMTSMLMSRSGYVYGPRYYQPAVVVAPGGFGVFGWILSMTIFLIVVGGVVVAVRSSVRS